MLTECVLEKTLVGKMEQLGIVHVKQECGRVGADLGTIEYLQLATGM